MNYTPKPVVSIPVGQGTCPPNIYLEWDVHINVPLMFEDFNLETACFSILLLEMHHIFYECHAVCTQMR